MVTFGIEEEYAFLDPETLRARDSSQAVYRALQVSRGESKHVQREFLLSQLERPTPVCQTLDDALGDLLRFRRRLAEAADSVGVLAVSTGTFPHDDGPGAVTDKPRYRRVVGESRALALEHYLNGLHVHVSIASRDEGARAINGLRPWMPVLIGLAANSPIWHGADSGFASWRTISLQRWATHGTPSPLVDAADYDNRVASVVGIGGTFDKALIAWNMRLSDIFPTIEIRAADAQLEVWQSVLIAALLRALVVTVLDDPVERGHLAPELLDSAGWHAARDGITDGLVHPFTGRLAPARQVIEDLVDYVTPALEREGELRQVREWVDRLFEEGSGAQRQRSAFETGGVPALAALLRGSLTRE